MRVLIIFLLILASACSGSKNSVSPNFVPSPVDRITLKRTGCFGTCPIYEVMIFGNGIVSYEGKAYTTKEGKYAGQLSPTEAITLFNKVNQMPWETYPEEYPIDNVDFPQFFIGYQANDIDKLVKGNTKAAEELLALSKEIDELIESLELQKQ